MEGQPRRAPACTRPTSASGRSWPRCAAAPTCSTLSRQTGVDRWFLHKLDEHRRHGEAPARRAAHAGAAARGQAHVGFSDEQIATLSDRLPEQVRDLRDEWDIRPVYKMVDTCAAEFDAATPYFYSTYEQENEAIAAARQEGARHRQRADPHRPGHRVRLLLACTRRGRSQRAGLRVDHGQLQPGDRLDRLRHQRPPLLRAARRGVACATSSRTKPAMPRDGDAVPPSIVQFGGQTAINLAEPLHNAARADHRLIVARRSTSPRTGAASRRSSATSASRSRPAPPSLRVEDAMHDRRARSATRCWCARATCSAAGRWRSSRTRPSSRASSQHAAEVERRQARSSSTSTSRAKRSRSTRSATASDVLIPGIMEHIERAGVHSGDSMAVYPAHPPRRRRGRDDRRLHDAHRHRARRARPDEHPVRDHAVRRSGAPGESDVYVLEVNPRGSRTVPFLSKVTGVPMVQLAVEHHARPVAAGAGLRGRPLAAAAPRRGEGAGVLDVEARSASTRTSGRR